MAGKKERKRILQVLMIPAGYMAKTVCKKPEWLDAPQVVDLYSVSGCNSEDFGEFIYFWKHNGHWLFNSPADIETVAKEEGLSLDGTSLFYYEIYEQEYEGKTWRAFAPQPGLVNKVVVPWVKEFAGVDVVTFFAGTSPECSPLSCNSLAHDLPTNEHCLFSSFEEAYANLESGAFTKCEPGPYRIFGVYLVDWQKSQVCPNAARPWVP